MCVSLLPAKVAKGDNAFAAVKLTGLGRPELLVSMYVCMYVCMHVCTGMYRTTHGHRDRYKCALWFIVNKNTPLNL